jgi:hypothetical protein
MHRLLKRDYLTRADWSYALRDVLVWELRRAGLTVRRVLAQQ